MGVYEADIYLELKPEVKWMPPAQKQAFIARMDAALKEMPGMEFNFTPAHGHAPR